MITPQKISLTALFFEEQLIPYSIFNIQINTGDGRYEHTDFIKLSTINVKNRKLYQFQYPICGPLLQYIVQGVVIT